MLRLVPRRMLLSPAPALLLSRRGACLSSLLLPQQPRLRPSLPRRAIFSAAAAAMSSSSPPYHHRFGDAEMEAATAELVPPLTGSRRKGQAGRVAVIGGCREYTGAPFFAAMAALRTGADLAHVFCTPGAAPVIKAYSPDLIVHPLLRESVSIRSESEERAGTTTTATTSSSSRLAALSVSDVEPWLPRFDAVVVGPGLGSDPAVEEAAASLMLKARELGIALLVDADALKLVSKNPESVRGYPGAILTPNAVEFERMAGSLGLIKKGSDGEGEGASSPAAAAAAAAPAAAASLRFAAAAFAGSSSSSDPDSPLDSVAAMALALVGPVVVRKGAGDCMAVAVSSGKARRASEGGAGKSGGSGDLPSPPAAAAVFSACCSGSGSPRRAGGQGDLTSGSVATFLAWACSRRLASNKAGEGEAEKEGAEKEGAAPPAALAAAFGGCSLVRRAAASAFANRRRAALASDVLDAIEGAEEAAPPQSRV